MTAILSHRTTRRVAAAMGAVVVALAALSVCGTATAARRDTAPTRDDHAALKRKLTDILKAHRAKHEFVGAVLALREPNGTAVTVTSGTKKLGGGGPVDPHVPWGVGSVTKMFVAVVVLQLAEEGRIDLDAGIDKYLPDLPGADGITPRQLLQHTSGLGEYISDPAVLADAQREWTPSELIAVAEAAGRTGEPGGPYHYSNTNYVVLGEIIKQVTGHSWLAEVRKRILEPLHMRNTGLGTIPGPPGYGLENGTFVDDTGRLNPSIGGAAGGMRSTASDLLKFTKALATGRLLSDHSQAEMRTFIPAEDLSDYGIVDHEYGLGLEKYTTDQVTAYGHLGSGSAQSDFIGFNPASGAAVVVMINSHNPGPQGVMALEALAVENLGR